MLLPVEIQAVSFKPWWAQTQLPSLAGIALEVGACRAVTDPSEPLLTTVTNGDGMARVDFPWSVQLHRAGDGSASVWVRPRAAGIIARLESQRMPDAPSDGCKLTAKITRGTVVRGELLGPDGTPVRGSVGLWLLTGDRPIQVNLAPAGADGRFEIETERTGPCVVLGEGRSEAPASESGPLLLVEAGLQLGSGVSALLDVQLDEPLPFVQI